MDNVVLVLTIAAFICSLIALIFSIYCLIRVANETSKKTQIIYDHSTAEERREQLEEQFGEIIPQDFGMDL